MFDVLSGKLNAALARLGNKGRLTEADVDSALREIRFALLEADVNFKVVRDLTARIKERSLAEKVLYDLSPGQQVAKITNEELTGILGGGIKKIIGSENSPSVILITGLNGSGKTTTAAKLARHFSQLGDRAFLVAADLNRPAAIQQLQVLGDQIDVGVYADSTQGTALKTAQEGVVRGTGLGAKWIIVDTAGRFHADNSLMSELEEMKTLLAPSETLMVIDAMMGQDAVSSARAFQSRIGLTGLVLTKIDDDARGGASISIVAVTGVPVKFVGTGEKLDQLEEFRPERMASRILGMGDVMSLVEKAQSAFGAGDAEQLEQKMLKSTLDLTDFLGQLQTLKRMGPLNQVLDMVPGLSSVKGRLSEGDVGEDQIRKVEAIIRSMTPDERRRPQIIGGSRRRRIALGSGTNPQDVNQLLSQFNQLQKFMGRLSSGKGLGSASRLFKNLGL